ncbi:hypothetical protein RIE95_02205 [Acidithiobacillus thiooxidans]|uniref:Polymerase nucleotidyl transferase domain-containing protein n=1 Tax=Acidithiobacillus thiooxidans ATCC 19377 TaxID=637390 RepID=A0A543Q1K8_ACITH|nr:hypothetical protein [Acidithiobacillus thiooxidans]MDR7925817.1 hypothetical protein [Acidithiobacillus thiooxidans]MDX5933126.1 hypothetical protein [Acidithiobacillus thiooxidans]TQN50160.1 hypothetical protein DLNHIDIE_02964 [Acidithiobacillus thiooxidans ATCC 19377]
MRPSEILRRHREEVLQIIAAHHANNPRIFGSVARGEDIEGSDIMTHKPRLEDLRLDEAIERLLGHSTKK